MIDQKILRLKKDVVLDKDLKFDEGTEFEIVADVVYIKGFMIPPDLQQFMYSWLVENMGNNDIIKEDFRRFK